jgi:hypothetical protein
MERYSQEFEICDYVEHGVRKQDIVVLKKRPLQETTTHRFPHKPAMQISENVSHEYH